MEYYTMNNCMPENQISLMEWIERHNQTLKDTNYHSGKKIEKVNKSIKSNGIELVI